MIFIFKAVGTFLGLGVAKKNYITLTYKKDTILFSSISVIYKIYCVYFILILYTYLYVTIFKLLIF